MTTLPTEGLLAVLRGGMKAPIVRRYEQELMAFSRVAALVELGKPVTEAIVELVEGLDLGPEGTGDLTDGEFAAFRVMTWLAPGWHGPGRRTERKLEEARLISGEDDGIGSRQVENYEKDRFASAVAQALGDVRPAYGRLGDNRDHRVFAQYINPEVLAADGQHIRDLDPARLQAQISWATRAALLATNDGVVFAASYVWEVPGFPEFLRTAGAELVDLGAISLVAPSTDLMEYRDAKQAEYRDDPNNVYRLAVVGLDGVRRVPWVTKSGRSAASDIEVAWKQAAQPGALLDPVVQAIIRGTGMSTAAVVRHLQAVPERLEGRAFVPRFVFRTIEHDLSTAPASAVRRLLSAHYLDSYSRDLDANLLINFPSFGRYAPLETHQLKTLPAVSALSLATALQWLGVDDYLFHRATWAEAVSFSRSPEFAVIYQRLIVDRDAAALRHVVRTRRTLRAACADSMSEVSRRTSTLALVLAA